MKAVSILLGAFVALMTAVMPASADTRAVYTISNIAVDETAPDTREAEAQAFAAAKVIGLRHLVAKITLPEDRALLNDEFYSYQNANSYAAAVDVDNEKRSATVYRADLSVLYNPTRIRAALNQAGVPYVDQQAPMSLVVPVASNPQSLDAWRAVWPDRDANALNPYVKALSYYTSNDGWVDIESEVRSVGAKNAILAELTGAPGAWQVRLVRETSGGATTIGVTNQVPTMKDAVIAASAYVDATWKRQSVIRDTSRTRTEASVLYSDLQTWNNLRQALSASALVSEFQVKAISANGALVSFAFAGDENRLISELRQRGVKVEMGPEGWVVTSALRMSR